MTPLTVGQIFQGSRYEDQLKLETESIHAGVAKYRKLAKEAVDRGDGASLKPAERLLVFWHEPILKAIREEQRLIARNAPGLGRGLYGPVIWGLDADRIALITLHEMVSKTMAAPADGVLLVHLAYSIGNAVVAEIHADMLRSDHRADWNELDRRFKNMNVGRVNAWAKKTLEDSMWSRRVCTHAGAMLINLASKTCSIGYEEWDPAFIHDKRWRDNQKKGVVILSDKAFDIIEDGHAFRQFLRPRYAPMVIPPCAWEDGAEGGYVKVRTPFISKPSSDQQEELKTADLTQIYDGLNALNAVPWQISRPAATLAREIWDGGGGVGKLPKAELEDMPPKPASIESDETARKAWKREAHEIHSRNAKLRGARIEFLQKLSIAENLIGESPIWFPHQMCFRSRAYPIPIHLNHHGDDVARSLLLFEEAKPLTEVGMRWLKIHAANMWGNDKSSFDDRVRWADENMDRLIEFGKHPLKTVDEWKTADEPFQFAAACMGLAFPEEIGARLPVQVDGSCNGIQHLCAASRDLDGGRHVNLVPGDTPADAYAAVLAIVCEKVRDDLEQGLHAASLVQGHLERKVVKQPTMTTVYNVTKVGARDQVRTQLQKRGVPREDLYEASAYLSGKVLESVGAVFPEAHRIMAWIEESTRMMCKAKPHQCISWVTPLGMPVVQPYRNLRKVQIRTVMQRLTIGDRDNKSPISLSKQVQGSIPNATHSWDGSHNLKTASECRDRGITFASVHDAYWTHAETMDELGSVLRDTFIDIHRCPMAQVLLDQWSEAYPEVDFPAPPSLGELDLDQVRDSQYFFA